MALGGGFGAWTAASTSSPHFPPYSEQCVDMDTDGDGVCIVGVGGHKEAAVEKWVQKDPSPLFCERLL